MKTLYGKFMAAFLGLVILIFALMFIGMEFFIETYYYQKKVDTMKATVKQIENIMVMSTSPIELLEDIDYLGYHFEGKISLFDVESGIAISDKDLQRFSDGTVVKTLEMGEVTAHILETDYPVKDTRWLVYYEVVGDKTFAMLQIPITAIEHTIEVVNVFLWYMAVVVLAAAFIIAAIVSRNMTRPIKRLTAMANEIRQLKFDVRYEDDRKDEIGELGETFNDLTERLSTTIDALTYELSKEKQLDKLRKEFVAQVSHELQTPLSIIHGYIEALDDGVADTEEERQEYYKIIYDESNKMSNMIKDLLQLSEFEAGTFKANEEVFDLCDFFDHLNQDYQTLFSHTDLSLDYKPLEGCINYHGDRMKLEQAFRNILNNAMKYAEEATTVYFHTTQTEQMITISIENHGPHIPDADLAKIFGSFFKGGNSGGKEGTGIGLAVAAKVFEYHKMTFYGKNTEKGVKFVMNMPLSVD